MRVVVPILAAFFAASSPARASACPPSHVDGGVALLTDFADGATTDYAPALRCAMAALCPDKSATGCGGVVQIPKGEFPFISTVVVDRPIRLVGFGAVSQLVWRGAKDEPLLRFDGSSSQSAENLLLAAEGHQGPQACRTDSAATNGVGVLASGHGRGPMLRGLAVCGFESGVQVAGGADGRIQDVWFRENRSAVTVDGAEGWILQSLLLDGGQIGLTVERSTGLRWLGGRVALTREVGIDVRGCVGCSIDGLRFEGNALDVRLGGGMKQQVKTTSLSHISGAERLAVVNPPSCPVDDLSLREVGGRGTAPVEVVVDSACSLRLASRQAEVTVTRRNSFDATGLHDVIAYEGVPSLRVTSDGRGLIGADTGTAGLTIRSQDGSVAELVHGAAAHRWQGGPQTIGASVGLRFLDASLRPAAELRSDGDLILRSFAGSGTGMEALRMAQSGRLGIGTASPTAGLDVAGDARVEGVLSSTAVTIPVGSLSDACRTNGQLQIVEVNGVDQPRVCVGGQWQGVTVGR